MKITLDTNNPGDLKLVQLIATVIAAESTQASTDDMQADREGHNLSPAEVEQICDLEKVAEPAEPEVDADGVEWDGELHASTKTKTADGRWKKKRNVKKAEPEAVEEEEPVQPEAAEGQVEVKESEYIAALTEHKNKWGIDRTREVIKDITGKDHPRDVEAPDWAASVQALRDDTGPEKAGFDLEDF